MAQFQNVNSKLWGRFLEMINCFSSIWCLDPTNHLMVDGGVGYHWLRYARSYWLCHCHQSPVYRKVREFFSVNNIFTRFQNKCENKTQLIFSFLSSTQVYYIFCGTFLALPSSFLTEMQALCLSCSRYAYLYVCTSVIQFVFCLWIIVCYSYLFICQFIPLDSTLKNNTHTFLLCILS